MANSHSTTLVYSKALKSCQKCITVSSLPVTEFFFYITPLLNMLVHDVVPPVLCVPLTTYPLDYDTFLLAHNVNSK